MKEIDKFFWGILGGIVVFVVTVLIVGSLEDRTEYISELQPEGVVKNYLLAIQENDYQRAYGYLYEELINYPEDLDQFSSDLGFDYLGDRKDSAFFSIQSIEINGSEAKVKIINERYSEEIFSGVYSTYDTYTLVKVDNEWKIKDSTSYIFFNYGWNLDY